MSYKLEVRAFFFNAKTDYLPYYKNFHITLNSDATAQDLLVQIKAQNENFSYPEENLVFKINNLMVNASEAVSAIVTKLGSSLQVDSANSYRSNNGLIINDDDFMQSFALLKPYATDADLEYYKTLYALHYASETEKFNRKYIGDAILVLASRMISKSSKDKEAILRAITSPYSGLFDCEYENNLFNSEDHTAAIEGLKSMVKPAKRFSLLGLFTKNNNAEKSIDNLEEKHIAYYVGSAAINQSNTIHDMISRMGATQIKFARQNKLSGLTLINDNLSLALNKAGTTLLDAFDSGAEVLVVEDNKTLSMFKQHFCAIEKNIGRKIIGLELISANSFSSQVRSVKV